MADHELMHQLASESGVSASHFLANFLRENLPENGQKMTQFSSKKCKKDAQISIYLSAEITDKIDKHIQVEKIKRSDFIRRVLSAELGIKRQLTGIEIEEIKRARHEVNHIGNNLNQIARKINSGELHNINRIDSNYLNRIIETVAEVEASISNHLE